MKERFYTNEREEHGRLQDILAMRYPAVSVGTLRRLMNSGRVLVNGYRGTRNQKLKLGDVIEIEFDEELVRETKPKPAEIEVLYEDARCLVINKPAGIAVVPERDAREYPMMSGLMHYLQHDSPHATGKPVRTMIVHRLDKDTTGALLIAKGVDAMRFYTQQFSERSVEKEYLAVVRGNPPDELQVNDPLTGKGVRRGRVVVNRHTGRQAETLIRVEEAFRGFALVRAFPKTGRRHQVRVHLRSAGFPIIGDPLYSGTRHHPDFIYLSELKRKYVPKRNVPEKPLIEHQALHAHRLHFDTISDSGETHRVTVEAPLPDDIVRLLKTLRKYRSAGKGTPLGIAQD